MNILKYDLGDLMVNTKILFHSSAFYFKAILSILLLIAIFDMPFGYYGFVRICVLALGIALISCKSEPNSFKMVYGIMAIIFLPILKFYPGKTGWMVIDFLYASFLIFSCFYKMKH